tara:strand:- start:1788 stop:2036 length:249 start_codon:yes stop_codon:yes gene_type:complete
MVSLLAGQAASNHNMTPTAALFLAVEGDTIGIARACANFVFVCGVDRIGGVNRIGVTPVFGFLDGCHPLSYVGNLTSGHHVG